MTRDEARRRAVEAAESAWWEAAGLGNPIETTIAAYERAMADAATGTVSAEEHDRRVTELLAANNALLERERAALAEVRRLRSAVDVTLNAIGKSWDEVNRLRPAVSLAARTFDGYADSHRAKGTPDGDAKADTNRTLAIEMRGALR